MPSLSEIEITVLEGVANGLTYRQIGKQIGYTFRGAADAGARAVHKLGANSLAHAVFVACQLRILDPTRRHGDHAGYAAHVYRNEEPCAACKRGESAYRAERRAARKAARI